MFKASAEAVLIVDAVNKQIVEWNPAAAKLLGAISAPLAGSPLLEAFDAPSARRLSECLRRANTVGRADAERLRTRAGVPLDITLTLFQAGARAYVLAHPTAHASPAAECRRHSASSPTFDAIDAAALGFLVTDCNFRLEYANQGFLGLVNLRSELSVRGTPLLRWLRLTAAQLASLREQMWSRRAIADFVTTLRPRAAAARTVEVSTVAVPDAESTLWGFCVRELCRPH